jgi:hypothetical protein
MQTTYEEIYKEALKQHKGDAAKAKETADAVYKRLLEIEKQIKKGK